MKDIKNKTKEFFDNIPLSNERKNQIYDNITNKRTNSFINYKLVTTIACCFVLALSLISVTYAEEIKESINTLKVKYFKRVIDDKEIPMTDVKSNTKAVINYQADINKGESNYSYSDLSEKLGINILRNTLFKNNNFFVKNVERNDDKIGFLLLGIDNVFDEQPDITTSDGNTYAHEYIKCDFEVSIATMYSDKKPGRVYSSGSTIEELYISSLDTTAIVARSGGSLSDTIWDVRFDYNNISYHLECFFFTSGNHKEELTSILNSFEL